ncbi:MAG TPA: MBL fold metallo-hydrolase [Candidatus Wallbacteria bacterium]|nr:MBL fold metallo-hydrolase [Candidatus Wallbacteria bacterium]
MLLKNILTTQLGELQTNCYIIYCERTKKCAIIDPGAEPEKLVRKIDSLRLMPEYILLTHGHYDHIGAVKYLLEFYKNYGIKLACHAEEIETIINPKLNYSEMFGIPCALPEPNLKLVEGDVIKIGDSVKLEVIHTPGHTFGGCCFKYEDKVLFSGDTLFNQSIGRTDLYGGSIEKIIAAIREKLFILDDKMMVLPGHGPHTNIGAEKSHNMYVE